MSTILIVGGNRGIGFELSRQLSERGDEVIVTSRTPSKNLASLDAAVIESVDVSIAADVSRLRQSLKGRNLDILIHNAGILSKESLDDMDFDRIERQFRVNTLGPLRVIHALLDNFSAGGRIGIVSSRMGSVGDNESGGFYGYRISKAGANALAASLARDLRPKDIAVAALHPGLVATEMTAGKGIPAERAARGLIERMDQLSLRNTGAFWHADGHTLPW